MIIGHWHSGVSPAADQKTAGLNEKETFEKFGRDIYTLKYYSCVKICVILEKGGNFSRPNCKIQINDKKIMAAIERRA